MKRTLQLLIDDKEDLTGIKRISTVFCSAYRTSFNRLSKGENPKKLIKKINVDFGLNKRYAEDAVLLAQGLIVSQKELLPLRVGETQTKIQKTEQKLMDYQTGKKTPKKVSLEVCINGLTQRLEKLQTKEKGLSKHIENGTIPKVIFGGRKNFYKRMEGEMSKEGWKELRSNTIYSRGDKSKKGNLNTRLFWDERQNRFFLALANPFDKKGNRSNRLYYQLHIPEKHFAEVAQIVMPNQSVYPTENGKFKKVEQYTPYTTELKIKNNRCYLFLTYDLPTPGEELKWGQDITTERIAGIDINIDRIAVSILTGEGRRLESKTFYCHKMEYATSNKRSNLAGELAKEVSHYLFEWNVGAIVLEDLNFKQTHDTNKKFNRLTVNFAYRKMHNALYTRGLKQGFKIKQVNAAYSSVIARFKYCEMYGLSVHEAASFVIGRRGLGLEEKIPIEIIRLLREKVRPHLLRIVRSMEESGRRNEAEKQKFLYASINNIDHFKKYHNWKLWNVVHKTLYFKKQEVLLQEV